LHWDKREDLYEKAQLLSRVIVTGRVSKFHVLEFAQSDWFFSDGLIVFADDSWEMYGVLQSSIHQAWVQRFKTTMRQDTTYSVSRCFLTFPRPEYNEGLGDDAKKYWEYRKEIVRRRGIGLTTLYNHFHEPECRDKEILHLRELHKTLDAAVSDSYGWSSVSLTYEFTDTRQGPRLELSPASRRHVLGGLMERNRADAKVKMVRSVGARTESTARHSAAGSADTQLNLLSDE
jgi:hypothetical protein